MDADGDGDWANETCNNCDVNGRDGFIDILSDFDDWGHLAFNDRTGAAFAPTPEDSVPLADETGLAEASRSRPVVEVPVVVKPGSGELPPVNVLSRGKLPIALLATEYFAADTLQALEVTFGATGTEVYASGCAAQYVDFDDLRDMVCHFPIQGSELDAQSTFLVVQVASAAGPTFAGVAEIRLVPWSRP